MRACLPSGAAATPHTSSSSLRAGPQARPTQARTGRVPLRAVPALLRHGDGRVGARRRRPARAATRGQRHVQPRPAHAQAQVAAARRVEQRALRRRRARRRGPVRMRAALPLRASLFNSGGDSRGVGRGRRGQQRSQAVRPLHARSPLETQHPAARSASQRERPSAPTVSRSWRVGECGVVQGAVADPPLSRSLLKKEPMSGDVPAAPQQRRGVHGCGSVRRALAAWSPLSLLSRGKALPGRTQVQRVGAQVQRVGPQLQRGCLLAGLQPADGHRAAARVGPSIARGGRCRRRRGSSIACSGRRLNESVSMDRRARRLQAPCQGGCAGHTARGLVYGTPPKHTCSAASRLPLRNHVLHVPMLAVNHCHFTGTAATSTEGSRVSTSDTFTDGQMRP